DPLIDTIADAIDNLLEINIFEPNPDIVDIPLNTQTNTNIPNQNQGNTTQTITDPVVVTTNNTNSANTNTTNNSGNTSSTPESTNTTNAATNNTPPTPEKLAFEATKLTASNSQNKKRIAKEGETLYYVNSEKKPKTDISLTINPNLAKDKIKDYVHWFSNNTAIDKSEGLLKFRPKDLDKNATIKSVAGSPTGSTKSVDVKFVDNGYYKNTLSLASGNFKNPLIKKAFEATKIVKNATDFLDKIPFIKKVQNKGLLKSGGINYFYTIIPFQEEFKRKEDLNSRLYYEETKTSGGFELGIEGKSVVWKWGLPFDALPLPQWTIDKIKEVVTAEVNIVASASSSGEMKAINEVRLYVESSTKKTTKNGVDPAILKLDIAFGVESEFSIGGDNDYLSGGINASGMTKAELFRIGYYDESFSAKLLFDGVYIELKASGYINTLGKKWETEKYFKKIELIEPNK
ncbi:hypothetical protein NTJ28_002533, partial [Flavobacterium psychrophilum]|nr:hypothetical protein [Flavobacterium psychrophilum]